MRSLDQAWSEACDLIMCSRLSLIEATKLELLALAVKSNLGLLAPEYIT